MKIITQTQLKVFYITIIAILFFALKGHAQAPINSLNSIHQSVLADAQFNKTYARGGCFVRAHWIAHLMNKEKLAARKVFLVPKQSGQKIKASVQQKTFEWEFHVAAAYQDPGTKEIWILDPVFSQTVLPLPKWKEKFDQQNPDQIIEATLTGPEVYHIHPEAIADWKQVSQEGPFSKEAMDYVEDAMTQLFDWEAYEP